MNSKEALNDLIDEIKHTHNNGKTLTEYDQKRTDIIAKDLEVLDILKSKIGLNYIPIQSDIKQEKYILTGEEITKEEYELFKEWLKNDRN